jgi:hypothetical protein
VSRPELSDTLIALVDAMSPVDEDPTRVATLVVEVDLDVPMEISAARRGAQLVILAAPGHTRFVSGFLPTVHNTRLHVVAERSDP